MGEATTREERGDMAKNRGTTRVSGATATVPTYVLFTETIDLALTKKTRLVTDT